MLKNTLTLFIIFAIAINTSAQSKLKTSKEQVNQGSTSSYTDSPQVIDKQHSGGSGSSFFDEEYTDSFFCRLIL